MNPGNHLIEVRELVGKGYQPCIDYGEWRVAFLSHISELDAERIDSMERHNQTDEVFLLLEGRCILLLGEGNPGIETIHALDMIPNTLYNIKKGVYHTHTLSKDALVLIVENKDTGPMNSDQIPIRKKQQGELIRMVQSLWASDRPERREEN